MLSKKQIAEVSNFSIGNWPQILQSNKLGCYYCLKIFDVKEIDDEVDKTGTLWCPYCFTDSVIGDAAPYEITEENLKQLQAKWFSHTYLSHQPFMVDDKIIANIDGHSLIKNGKVMEIGYIVNGKRYTSAGGYIAPFKVVFHFGSENRDLFYFENSNLVYSDISLETPTYLKELYAKLSQEGEMTFINFISKVVREYAFKEMGI